MKRASLTLLCMIMGVTPGRAGEAIPAKMLQELKGGTVFLRVQAGVNSASGSGFLIHAADATGYIVTNWHVVHVPVGKRSDVLMPASSIEAVFFSGSKNEVVYKAELVAGLPNEDLAVLRVKNVKNLPVPLKLAAKVSLTETMPVFCLGFPFGKSLGVDNRNPAITVSKGALSSLRYGKDDDLVLIQIDGALNPGNSGGPVVDSEGHIIGVAVAAIKGAQIGFAVPAAEVAKIMAGRALGATIELAKSTGKGTELSVQVKLADPLRKLRSVALHYVRQDAAKEKPVVGQAKPLAGSSKAELTISDQKAIGSIRLAEDKTVYWVQVVYAGSDGKEQYLAVSSLRVDPSAGAVVVRGDLEQWKGKTLVVHFSLSDAGARQKVVERVKELVGNTLRASRASTIGARTIIQLFPVNDPSGFVDRLKEVGQVTRVDGGDIFLSVSDAAVVTAKTPDPKKETKGGEKTPSTTGAAAAWVMDLGKMAFPEGPAAGKILGADFTVDDVKLDAVALTLRQGKDFFPDAAIVIFLGIKPGESIEGKSYEIGPDSKPGKGTPAIHLQQKGPNDKLPQSQAFPFRYAMKLEFGMAKEGGVPGNIYVCLPDQGRSFVAGSFMVKLR